MENKLKRAEKNMKKIAVCAFKGFRLYTSRTMVRARWGLALAAPDGRWKVRRMRMHLLRLRGHLDRRESGTEDWDAMHNVARRDVSTMI